MPKPYPNPKRLDPISEEEREKKIRELNPHLKHDLDENELSEDLRHEIGKVLDANDVPFYEGEIIEIGEMGKPHREYTANKKGEMIPVMTAKEADAIPEEKLQIIRENLTFDLVMQALSISFGPKEVKPEEVMSIVSELKKYPERLVRKQSETIGWFVENKLGKDYPATGLGQMKGQIYAQLLSSLGL